MRFLLAMSIAFALGLGQTLPAQEVEDMGLSPEQREERLAYWVNSERTAKGLPALKIDQELSQIARDHSRKMAEEKTLAHYFPSYDTLEIRMVKAGLHFSFLGENIARGDTFVMRFVHQALMESPEHRQNIFSTDFDRLGIGIIFNGQDYYTTQVFARSLEVREVETLEQELVNRLEGSLSRDRGEFIKDVPDLVTLCRQNADDFLQGRRPYNLTKNWPWGKSNLTAHSFVDSQAVIATLVDEIEARPSNWILGVGFGRTRLNSGGCYAVCLITFPLLDQSENPDRIMFERMNEILSRNGKAKAMWSNFLASAAKTYAQSFIDPSLKTSLSKRFILCLAYETFDMSEIPAIILERMLKSNINQMGVHVIYPIKKPAYKNAIVVAIIGK